MSHARRRSSTLAALILAGCAAPGLELSAPPPAAAVPASADDGSWPFRTTTRLGHDASRFVALGVGDPDGAVVSASPAPPPGPEPEALPSPAARLLPSLTGGTFDRSYGAALDEAIAALPEARRDLGVAGVDSAALFGTDTTAGLCEDPHVLLSVDGAEASLAPPWGFWMAEAPARDRAPLPEDCVAALLAAGTVDTTTCAAADVRAHFPDGSACRECLTLDGDHARCVDEAACVPEATRQIEARGAWFGVLTAPALLCAPDHVEDVTLLVEDLIEADPLPAVYDHGAVSAHCLRAYDGEGVDLFCDFGDHHAIGDALPSRVDFIRAEGAASTWDGRVSLVASVEVEGHTFARTWLSESGATGVSAPLGSVVDAWGVNPTALRPDGIDPEDPEDTFARDYIAAFVLKLATARDGVPVNPVNHNRCADDAWEGPHGDGTWSCDEPGAWSTAGWSDDALIAWWDQRAGEIYTFPLVTLASTGLPDPAVPGGLLPEVLGSTTLMDDGWEACTWPQTFVPDRVRLYDAAPGTSDTPYASFDGQTYRFGRDPDVDVRFFLATNQQRGFCPP